jgi:hypothetical protein
VAIDVFLIGLIIRSASGLWKNIEWRESERYDVILKWSRRVGVAVCILLIVGCGLTQAWRFRDWFLWPLDNVLRAADIGDMFQIFNWRLHGVEMGFGTTTLAVSLRLVAAITLAEWINRWRLQHLRGWGVTVDELIEAVGSSDDTIRAAAAKALLRLGAAAAAFDRIGPVAVSALITILKSRDDGLRRAAAAALGRIGPAAVPALINVLKSGDRDHCDTAAEALVRIGPTAVPALIEILKSPDEYNRLAAAAALGKIGPASVPVPTLINTLKSEDGDERSGAAAALGEIGPAAVTGLINVVNSADGEECRAAAEALGSIGPAAEAAVPVLIEFMLSTCNGYSRSSAAEALGKIAPANREMMVALREVAKDPKQDERVRRAATEAWRQIKKRAGKTP